MADEHGTCPMGEHGTVLKSLAVIEAENKVQWDSIKGNRDRIDSILGRVNIVLGSLIAGCVLLVINLIIELVKKQ